MSSSQSKSTKHNSVKKPRVVHKQSPETGVVTKECTARPSEIPRYACFLSMPYEFHDLRKSIIDTLDSLKEFQIECRYVTESSGKELRQEVIDRLSGCDFIIAGVSSRPGHGEGPRPNIMWELGFAWKMSLNRIIIVNNSEQKNVSSLIIDQHYIPYNAHNAEALLRELREAVKAICSSRELERSRERSESRYAATVYINRVEINLPKQISETRKEIRILETNLECVQKDLGDHLVNALKDPNRPDLTVQLCTLDPHSVFAKARALQLASLQRDYETKLITALDYSYKLLSECDPDRWEIRVYDTFPTQITFTFDEQVFNSVLSLGRRARDLLHFEVVTTNRNASDTFRAHFNQIYSQSIPYAKWAEKSPSQHRSA